MLAIAVGCGLLTAGPLAQAPEPAFVRHRPLIHELQTLRRADADDRRRTSSRPRPLDGLTAAELQARFAPVLQDLEADLRGGALSPHQAYSTFEALGAMGETATPAIPTIVAVLDAWDHDRFFRIPYLCSAVKALAEIAPTSPDVIQVLANALSRELPSRGSVCHRCGCILEALERSGPAARDVAGPVLERVMAEPRFLTTYHHQLGRALASVGIGTSLPIALRRVTRNDVLPGDRAETLRALARESGAYSSTERAALRTAAAGLLGDETLEVRVAAAETLGATGPEAVDALRRALGDWHFAVRVAAAEALGRVGAPAVDAAPQLAAALDPFLGTAMAAGKALVAIGPGTLPAIEARRAQVAAPLAPIVAAAAQAVRAGRTEPLQTAIARTARAGPHGQGFAHVEVRQAGRGALAYDPGRHRIRLRYTVLRYLGPGRNPEAHEDRVTVSHAANTALSALRGRRTGDRVRLTLSPDIAQAPTYGSNRHRESWTTHVGGTTGLFDVAIERVCEPVVWTLFRGSGAVNPIRFELYCRD